ncbi:hypothetical protein BGX27_002411, partial [Mortierella sp. AM989]
MSSYSAYQSQNNPTTGSHHSSRAPTPTSPAHSDHTHVYTVDYNTNASVGSPTSTLYSAHPARGPSPTMGFSNTPLPEPTRWKMFRIKVMRMATVPRLQLLWGLLALFGSMSWMALMPAYAFRNKLAPFHP